MFNASTDIFWDTCNKNNLLQKTFLLLLSIITSIKGQRNKSVVFHQDDFSVGCTIQTEPISYTWV